MNFCYTHNISFQGHLCPNCAQTQHTYGFQGNYSQQETHLVQISSTPSELDKIIDSIVNLHLKIIEILNKVRTL